MTSVERIDLPQQDSARTLVATLFDDFEPLTPPPVEPDPLGWPGYGAMLDRARERSGADESVLAGCARLDDARVVVVAFEFAFLGGSMGMAAGARIAAAIDEARASGRPLVSLIATGGARMQEGMCALTQMQRVAAAVAGLRAAGVPHVSVLRHPTTGGVWASFASTADVIIAVRGATVAFAGARVRGDADDDRPFTADGKLESGFADTVVEPDELGPALRRHVALLAAAGVPPLEPAVPPVPLGRPPQGDGAWDSVQAARDPARPRARAYLDAYFDDRIELCGDRTGHVDAAMLCGLGQRGGRVIAYVAQTGLPNVPAGFRAARRLLTLADRLRVPVLTLIDTPGAANDAAAERQGIGTAIAELFVTMASVTVPVTSVVIGEGGSGGALALAAPRALRATPDSYFAVIAPEGAAAILHRDPGQAQAVAPLMQLRPQDLVRLGVVREVL